MTDGIRRTSLPVNTQINEVNQEASTEANMITDITTTTRKTINARNAAKNVLKKLFITHVYVEHANVPIGS